MKRRITRKDQAELKACRKVCAEMRHCLRELKVRIAYIGMPQEPMWEVDGRKFPDWRKWIALLEKALTHVETIKKNLDWYEDADLF